MSWLCRIGLHRWDFWDDVQGEPGRTRTVVTMARCRRGCPRYDAPMVVHVESFVFPSSEGVTITRKPSTSARESATAGEPAIGEEPCEQ